VADAGQGVVLGDEGDTRLARAERRAEGGGDLADAALQGEAVGLEVGGQLLGRPVLLESDFGVGVDVEGDRDELVAAAIDVGGGALFECGGVRYPAWYSKRGARPDANAGTTGR
jgi:hypothetical protein